MHRYRLLIIDDEVSIRKKAYHEVLDVLGSFDIAFVERPSELRSKISSTDAAGYIVDVRLDNWSLKLEEVLRMIGKRGPVILVSSRWLKHPSETEFVTMLRTFPDSPVRGFFAWSEFYDAAGNIVNEEVAKTTVWKIRQEIATFYRRSSISLGDSAPVNMIHISDTQFGDSHEDGAAFLMQCAIGKFLRRQNFEPHFLVITGDIAFSGKPSEYAKAMTWFSAFTDELWPGRGPEMKERVLIVPGNHDVNLTLSSADDYKYNVKARKLEPVKGPALNSEHLRFGLAPFMAFAHDLTGDVRWLSFENQLCWTSDLFLDLGIRFFHLNTVAEASARNPDRCSVPKMAMETMASQSKNYPEKGLPVFNVFISHHGRPQHSLKGYENWDQVLNFLEISCADLLIHGHGHAWQGSTLQEGDSVYDTVDIMAPSTHVGGRRRPPDERRGFNLISLERKSGIVTRIRAEPYEAKGATVQSRKVTKKSWKAPQRHY